MIEPVVSWGSILTVVSVVVSAIGLGWKLSVYHAENRADMAVVKDRVDTLWHFFETSLERRAPRRRDEYDG